MAPRREQIGIDVTANAAQARREISSLGGSVRELGGASQETAAHHSALGGAIRGVATGAVMGVGFAAFNQIAGAVGGFGDAIFGMNSMLEKSTLQFEVLYKDSDRAKQHVADLFEFAKKTPFETGPVIQASRTLQTFGGDALNTMKNLTMFGDAAAGASVDINEVSFWVGRAYAAIKGGQPFGEARMRLQELALLSPQAAAKMEKLQKAGADTSEVWAIMEQELGRFSGSMEKQASTWDGVISTLADTVKLTLANTFHPLFESIKGGISGAIAFLSSDAVQGAFAAFGAGLGKLINFVGEAVGALMTVLGPPINLLIELFGIIFPDATSESEEALGDMYEGIEPVSKAAGGLLAVIRPLMDAIGLIGDYIGDQLDNWFALADAVGSAFGAMASGGPVDFSAITTALDDIMTTATEFVVNFGTLALDAISGFVTTLLDNLPMLTDGFLNFFTMAVDWVINTGVPMLATAIGQLADKFITWVNDVLPRLGDELPKILNKILDWLGTNLPKLVGKLVQWGAALIGWILPRLPGLIANLIQFLAKMVIWFVTEGIPKLLDMAFKMGAALVNGILDILLGRNGQPGLLKSIGDWITKSLIPGILGFLSKLVDAGIKLGQGIGKGFGNALLGFIEDAINFFVRGINNMIRGINRLIEALPGDQSMDTFGYINPIKLPRLAVGAMDVPQDMLAIVHRGEMVLPASVANLMRPSAGPAFSPAGLGGTVNVTIYQTFGPSSVRSREDIREIGRETAQRARLLGLSVNNRQVGSIAG